MYKFKQFLSLAGVEMSYFVFQNWTSRPPFLQSYILCNTVGRDVGDPHVAGPDVPHPYINPYLPNVISPIASNCGSFLTKCGIFWN